VGERSESVEVGVAVRGRSRSKIEGNGKCKGLSRHSGRIGR